jgi:two-component system response regulator HydG
MQRLLADLERLEASELPVLISGETGSGKGLVARAVHERSPRRSRQLHAVDCAAIPASLLEAELFGAAAGAFTGSVTDRRGILEAAAGGTLLLDNISEAPLEVQAKLLRLLSDRSFRRLGSEEEFQADVRFLFTSTPDLEQAVAEGRFRRDLYHRIHVVVLRVPPLRERPEDMADLVRALIEEGEGRGAAHSAPLTVEREALDRLRAWSWPGNVRELRNVLLRLRIEAPAAAAVRAEDVERVLVGAPDAALFPRQLLAGPSLQALQQRLERDYVLFHLRRLGGDSEALAQFLGLSRRQLYRRVERLGISLRRERR